MSTSVVSIDWLTFPILAQVQRILLLIGARLKRKVERSPLEERIEHVKVRACCASLDEV